MAGPDDPPPAPKPPLPPILDDPIVAQARTALGGMFASTIEALGKDMQTRIAASNTPQTAVSAAVSDFTTQMIKLLASRVTSVMPQAPAPAPPATPPAAPPAAAPAAPAAAPPAGSDQAAQKQKPATGKRS